MPEQIPSKEWSDLVRGIIAVYVLRDQMYFDGDKVALHQAIIRMRHRLDAIVPPEEWKRFNAPEAGRRELTD